MKQLYEFNWNIYRQGQVNGLFVQDEQVVNALIGRPVYFGEILGKHSTIFGTLDKDDFKILNVLPSTIDDLLKVFGSNTISGYNPLKYINYKCERCKHDFKYLDSILYIDFYGCVICDDCTLTNEEQVLKKLEL